MDNASQQTRTISCWGGLVKWFSKNILTLQISFLVSGHNKFFPDVLFANIVQTVNCNDVFNTDKLRHVAEQYANVMIEDMEREQPWRNALPKHSAL